jgi:hypothetical protein
MLPTPLLFSSFYYNCSTFLKVTGLKIGFGTKVSNGNNKNNSAVRLDIFMSTLTATYKV